jgi:uncharacterized UPF0160 family protein
MLFYLRGRRELKYHMELYKTIFITEDFAVENKKLARAYYKLLSSIDWNDEVLVNGLREGLNKFITNAYLKINAGKNKYFVSHYISKNADKKLKKNDVKGLVFEHIIPKQEYIQRPCEEMSKKGTLTEEFILNQLNKYWIIATITKDENKRLSTKTMPEGWDGINIFERYKEANIELKINTFK